MTEINVTPETTTEEIIKEIKDEIKEEIKIEYPECVLLYISLGEEIEALESKIELYESSIEDQEERLEKYLNMGTQAKGLGANLDYILLELAAINIDLIEKKTEILEDREELDKLYNKRSDCFTETEALGWEYAPIWKTDKIFPYCSHTWRIKKSPEEIKEELEKMEPGTKAFIQLFTAFNK